MRFSWHFAWELSEKEQGPVDLTFVSLGRKIRA